ncbi:MAG: nitroreductase/quinone reductase family protein [Myxococcota bacterium]
MRWIVRFVVLLLVLFVAFIGAIFAASEFGGEVVTLRTREGSAERRTHLWVVDDAGFAWLRAGEPSSGWLARIDANPDVTVERGGVTTHFHAVPVRDPAVRDRIHALMREKYPLADRFISAMRDPNGSVPVKLEPVPAP